MAETTNLPAQFCTLIRDHSERKDAVNQNIDESEPLTGPVARAAVVTLDFFLNSPPPYACCWNAYIHISPAGAAVSHIYQDKLSMCMCSFDIKPTASTVLHDSDWAVCVYKCSVTVMTLMYFISAG